MLPQKTFILWLTLSLGLHIIGLTLCPIPTVNYTPPYPVYIVVDLFSGPAPSSRGAGSSVAPEKEDRAGAKATPPAHHEAAPAQLPRPAAMPGMPLRKTPAPAKPSLGGGRPPSSRSADHLLPEPAATDRPATPEPVEPESPIPLQKTPHPSISAETLPSPGTIESLESGLPVNPDTGPAGESLAEVGTGGGSGDGRAVDPASGSPVETPLAYGSNPPPPYPFTARRRGWEGKVLLRVKVSASGSVRHVAVEQSSGYASLDEAALQAVYLWRFKPALQNGRPVPGVVRVPIHFTLQ